MLAGGSIESPKLLRRSSLYPWLPQSVKDLLGRGLTDHPTSNEITTFVTHIGNVPIPKSSQARIVFYSRGLPDPSAPSEIRYPFNVEMNINHEYWHLRENDYNELGMSLPLADPAASRLDIKFSFGNCLDDANEIKAAPPFGYVFAVMNQVTFQIFSLFQNNGSPARPQDEIWYGQGGKGFGWGTVHHSAGTLRMHYKAAHDRAFEASSVVDEDLRVVGMQRLHVCDMSVMPFSSAANPVRTLAALALRLARQL